MRFFLLPILPLVVVACTHNAKPTSAPSPAVASVSHDSVDDRVPDFQSTPLLAEWGPLPPGTDHPERVRTYHIEHQIIRLRFDWDRHAVIGSTTLRVAALDTALREVDLDAVHMTNVVAHAGEHVEAGVKLPVTYNDTVLRVMLPHPVAPHQTTVFTVDYEAVKPAKGMYFIDRRHDLWTQGETDENRYWIPTYDYPNDKTTWEFYVRVAKNEKALSNGRLISTRVVGDDVEWHWSLEEPASTYLMSVAAGDYAMLTDSTSAKVPVHYWVYPDSTAAGWRGFGLTPHAIALYERLLGVPYPWEKYDQIVAPDFEYGGQENVTATTQNDNEILHPAWAEPVMNTDELVSHELAHQWFGDYLTMRTWADSWLNEGFATFMEQIHAEWKRGAADGAIERMQAEQQTIGADQRARRPIVYDRWETDPIEVFFSGHIYPKGAYVLQALRHDMGDTLFWAAMHHYVTAHARGSVTTADFEHAMEEVSGQNYSTLFKQWVYGAGFPVFQVSAKYDSAASKVTFRARQVQPRDSLTGFFDANVSIEVLTKGGTNFAVVMPVHGEVSTVTLPLPPGMIPGAYVWNNGQWLLEMHDFPRSTNMLAFQLKRASNVLDRLEALRVLAQRTGDAGAIRALEAAAVSDKHWSVRALAVKTLGEWADTSAVSSVVVASRDSDAHVRVAAAEALGNFPGALTVARLKDMVNDSSLFVHGPALASLARVDSTTALPLIEAALQRDSWLDTERRGAQAAMAILHH